MRIVAGNFTAFGVSAFFSFVAGFFFSVGFATSFFCPVSDFLSFTSPFAIFVFISSESLGLVVLSPPY
jgi:hypothetical protein